MDKYFIDPDGSGVLTIKQMENDIASNEWIKKWTGGLVANYVSDCTYLGTFESSQEAWNCYKAKMAYDNNPYYNHPEAPAFEDIY